MFRVVTSPQLNQVNTLIGNNQISPNPLGFEASQTPMVNSPIFGIWTNEMFQVVANARLNQVSTPIGNNQISLVPPSSEVS
jgi:hypothetical protein